MTFVLVGGLILLVLVVCAFTFIRSGKDVKDINEDNEESQELKLWDACSEFVRACSRREDAIAELEGLKNQYRNKDGSIDFKYLSEDYRDKQKNIFRIADKDIYKSVNTIIGLIPENMSVKIEDYTVWRHQEFDTMAEVQVVSDSLKYGVRIEDLLTKGGKIKQWRI